MTVEKLICLTVSRFVHIPTIPHLLSPVTYPCDTLEIVTLDGISFTVTEKINNNEV